MVEDRQTHSLPQEGAALDNVALLDGRADARRAARCVAPACRSRRPHLRRARRARRPHAAGARARSARRSGRRRASPMPRPRPRASPTGGAAVSRSLRSAAAQEALEAVLPGLVAALGAAPDPATALNRFDDVIARLPSAINLFRLLEARPPLARLVCDVLSLAPTLADMLSRRPDLIDGLIDASALDPPARRRDAGAAVRGGRRRGLSGAARSRAARGRRAAVRAGRADRLGGARSARCRGRLCADRRGRARGACPCHDRRVRGRARPHRRGRIADPGPGPLRRRGAHARLRSRSRLPVHRRPSRRIGRAKSRSVPPTISTGWRSASPPRSPYRPPRGRSTRSIRGCGPRARRGCSRSASTASRATSAKMPGRGSIWRWRGRGPCSDRRRHAHGSTPIIAETLRQRPRSVATGRRRRQDAPRHRGAQAARRSARRQADAGRAGRSRIPRSRHAVELSHRLRSAARASRSPRWSRRGCCPARCSPRMIC